MSTIWTPSGEHQPQPDEPAGAGPDPTTGRPETAGPPTADEAAALEELRRVRAELAATPVADIVANHAVGLWQLAVLHLIPEDGQPADLVQAGLAIDAMAGLVEGLGDRLGENADPLRDALAQLRLMFVQVTEGPGGTAPAAP